MFNFFRKKQEAPQESQPALVSIQGLSHYVNLPEGDRRLVLRHLGRILRVRQYLTAKSELLSDTQKKAMLEEIMTRIKICNIAGVKVPSNAEDLEKLIDDYQAGGAE